MAEHNIPQLDIPASVAAALNSWVRQAAQDVGSPLRSEIEDLRAQLATAHATLEENEDQITRLNGELRNARNIAADALVGKAKDQLAIEGKDAQIADLRSQLERSVAVAATLSDFSYSASGVLFIGAVLFLLPDLPQLTGVLLALTLANIVAIFVALRALGSPARVSFRRSVWRRYRAIWSDVACRRAAAAHPAARSGAA